MLNWLRRWLSATPDEIERLEARQDALERDWQQMELNLTGLTDKLSAQLKRYNARRSMTEPEMSREDMLNEAIRARRRSRFPPLNGAE
jgi:predicted  nucleic acid-binding Zn-ribbon protein